MSDLVDVAVPIGVERTFTYRVPEELRHAIALGKRVTVPLGRKVSTGLIIGLPASSSLSSLKSIIDVLDLMPVVSPELFSLCRWVAEYYQAPTAEVFKAALPHGFSPSSKTLVRALLTPESPGVAALLRSAPKRRAVFQELTEHGPRTMAELTREMRVRSINALVHGMAADGLVATEEVAARSYGRPRTESFVDINAVDGPSIERALAALSPRKKKVRLLASILFTARRAGTSTIPLPELLRAAGCGLSHLRELQGYGAVPVFERPAGVSDEYGSEQQTLDITLNLLQQRVLARIQEAMTASRPQTFLLHGVTGSGKTQVYIEAIRSCLALGKTAIVLVPEIALTPQIVRRFKSHFGDTAVVVHSRMAPRDRINIWRQAMREECRIVIGPRSAVFAPLPRLGLVVVDEEHETSYKQFDALPRYHARDVAVVRGHEAGAVVVLGSATPSIESYANALQGKYELLEMMERVDNVPMPPVTIVDMTAERKRAYALAKEALPVREHVRLKEFRASSISGILQQKIAERLRRGEGIILLQNRRGYAPFIECEECGYAEMCSDCSVTMTYHQAQKHLRCHYCGAVRRPALLCPTCGGTALRMKGAGTQRVEEELASLFPAARIVRMDLDTTTGRGSHDRLLRLFGEKKADILLGTQMVAKGLDFPHVTLVGVISADTQMLLPDFRSAERTFQLLTQVAGRAGRSTLTGEVIVQTHQPQHYALRHVLGHDYRSFYDEEISSRRELSYPPASRLVLIEFRGEREEAVADAAERLGALLQQHLPRESVLGPAPAVLGRLKKQYRWHILVKGDRGSDPSGVRMRGIVRRVLQSAGGARRSGVHIIIDVDPVGTL